MKERGEEGVGSLRQNCVTGRRSVVKKASELRRRHLELGDHVLVIVKPLMCVRKTSHIRRSNLFKDHEMTFSVSLWQRL